MSIHTLRSISSGNLLRMTTDLSPSGSRLSQRIALSNLSSTSESGLDILQTDSRLERVLVDWTGRNPDSDFRVHYRQRTLHWLQLRFFLICLITHSITMHECAHYDGSTVRGIRLETCF